MAEEKPKRRKRKSVKLRGARQRMQTCCPQCGAKKTIEYRYMRGVRWLSGAEEVVDKHPPDCV